MGTRTRIVGLAATVALAGALMAVAVASAAAVHASARIVDASGAEVGRADLTQDSRGVVHMNVHVKGLSAGLHGIHLHSVAACALGTTPTFSSAGAHHNPLGYRHGLLSAAGPHAGDLPNLTVNGAGVGHLNAMTNLATLAPSAVSLFDFDGSSIVIHAAEDDQMTDPTGNSGARIACGVIVAG